MWHISKINPGYIYSLRIGSSHGAPTLRRFEFRQRWQCPDQLTSFRFGNTQIIDRLQIQPELRAVAEEVAKPQGRIARD